MYLTNFRLMAVGVTMSAVLLSGCAATQVAISKRNLDLQTKMSATTFLDPVKESRRTVFVQIRNTSDRPDLDIRTDVAHAIAARAASLSSTIRILRVSYSRRTCCM